MDKERLGQAIAQLEIALAGGSGASALAAPKAYGREQSAPTPPPNRAALLAILAALKAINTD
jgi:hypothetical protein